jgi:hypothetical protein
LAFRSLTLFTVSLFGVFATEGAARGVGSAGELGDAQLITPASTTVARADEARRARADEGAIDAM